MTDPTESLRADCLVLAQACDSRACEVETVFHSDPGGNGSWEALAETNADTTMARAVGDTCVAALAALRVKLAERVEWMAEQACRGEAPGAL